MTWVTRFTYLNLIVSNTSSHLFVSFLLQVLGQVTRNSFLSPIVLKATSIPIQLHQIEKCNANPEKSKTQQEKFSQTGQK